MFLVISVHYFTHKGRESHMAITLDSLDLTVVPPSGHVWKNSTICDVFQELPLKQAIALSLNLNFLIDLAL